MDEPFAALDAIVRARVSQRSRAPCRCASGISVLLVTHDLEEALALSDDGLSALAGAARPDYGAISR